MIGNLIILLVISFGAFLLMRHTKKGIITFVVLSLIFISANLIHRYFVLSYYESQPKNWLGWTKGDSVYAIKYFETTVLEALIFMLIAVAWYFISKRKRKLNR